MVGNGQRQGACRSQPLRAAFHLELSPIPEPL
jgi:hypothetical protein